MPIPEPMTLNKIAAQNWVPYILLELVVDFSQPKQHKHRWGEMAQGVSGIKVSEPSNGYSSGKKTESQVSHVQAM